MNDIFKNVIAVIKKYRNIVIVSHKNIDLDGFSSAVGLAFFIQKLKRNSYVYFDLPKTDETMQKAISILETKSIEIPLIDHSKLQKLDPNNTLLIVVDTHKQEMLEEVNLLKWFPNVIVLDHHVKGPIYIKDTILTYINSNMSSMVELVVDLYQIKKQPISPTLATIMLAGMEIDTNRFQLKVSANTHENAAYLMNMGADIIAVQELLQIDKDDYIKSLQYIENSYLWQNQFMICVLDEQQYARQQLARIADVLLMFERVQASFVIGYIEDDVIGISARSLGKIDVEQIMKQFKGGGHVTDAAAQIEAQEIQHIKSQLEGVLEMNGGDDI